MRRVVPRDPLLVGRIGALAGAGVWLFIGGQAIVPVAALALAATVDSYRAEQSRAEVALRLGRSLERVATEIAAETEPEQLLRTIARGALALVEAQHATVNIRRGEEFVVAAGAGTGERVV